MTASFRFSKLTKMDHFWHFWLTFDHTKCKRSSLRSQIAMLNETFFCDFQTPWHSYFATLKSNLSIISKFCFFFSVAYSADEVIYVWQLPKKKAVDYEGKLQLSQFDIMETAFRGLNYSRGNNSEFHTLIQKCIFGSKIQVAKNSTLIVNLNFCA